MTSLKANIQALCKAHNMTVKALENAIDGISQGTIGKWDKSPPSVDKALLVARYFNVSLDFLVGNDAYITAETLTNEERDILLLFHSLSKSGKASMSAFFSSLYNELFSRSENNVVDLRPTIRHYFSRPAAGVGGMEAGADYEDIPLPDDAPKNADYCLTVSGDSMEPYIPDGSMVYVLEDERLEDFDVGVFMVNGSTFIKQICRGFNGELYLLSANPKRESANITIHPDGNERFEYQGKVILKKKLPQPIYD